MKKTISIFFVFLISASVSFSQKYSMQLKFTGFLNSQNVSLDSIRISNKTQACDTVLYWPDTVISFTVSVVGFQGKIINDPGFEISQVEPLPGQQNTMIRIFVPVNGEVNLSCCDLNGRRLLNITQLLQAGINKFSFSPGSENIYLVSASWKGITRTLKIISALNRESRECRLSFYGFENNQPAVKALPLTYGFHWAPWNNLKITAYHDTLQAWFYTAPSVTETDTLNFFPDRMCPGIPTVYYGGYLYNTVQIGNQCWFAENLNIGTMISTPDTALNNGIIEKFCYNNDPSKCEIYGGLYQWNEMMQYDTTPGIQGICPPGWHIPTETEIQALIDYLGGTSLAGGPMKETGLAHWSSPNQNATNLSGFTALGGGYIYPLSHFLNSGGYFWTSSEISSSKAHNRFVWNGSTIVNQQNTVIFKRNGISVRCLKN